MTDGRTENPAALGVTRTSENVHAKRKAEERATHTACKGPTMRGPRQVPANTAS